jgi:hypothetical protein
MRSLQYLAGTLRAGTFNTWLNAVRSSCVAPGCAMAQTNLLQLSINQALIE